MEHFQHALNLVETHDFTPVGHFGAVFESDFVSERDILILLAPKCLGPYFELLIIV